MQVVNASSDFRSGWREFLRNLRQKSSVQLTPDTAIFSHSGKYAHNRATRRPKFCKASAPQIDWTTVVSKRDAAKVRKATVHHTQVDVIDNNETNRTHLNDITPSSINFALISHSETQRIKDALFHDIRPNASRDNVLSLDEIMSGKKQPSPNVAKRRKDNVESAIYYPPEKRCATGMNFILNGNLGGDGGKGDGVPRMSFNRKT